MSPDHDRPTDVHDPPDLESRQCGRCRKMFPADPSQHPDAMPDWWVCDDCRLRLLPSG